MKNVVKTILLGAVGSILGTGTLSLAKYWITQSWFSILETTFIFLFVSIIVWLLILTLRIKKGISNQEDNEFKEFKKEFEEKYKPSIGKSLLDLNQKLRELMQALSQKHDEIKKYQNIDPGDEQIMFILRKLAGTRSPSISYDVLFKAFWQKFDIKGEKAISTFRTKTNFLKLKLLIYIDEEERECWILEEGLEYFRIAEEKSAN